MLTSDMWCRLLSESGTIEGAIVRCFVERTFVVGKEKDELGVGGS